VLKFVGGLVVVVSDTSCLVATFSVRRSLLLVEAVRQYEVRYRAVLKFI
jgi:hypothetical protein